MKYKTFVLHDETLNTHGFWMRTSGCNLSAFKKNPVMLLNHDYSLLPIGRWENVRVEGKQILADANFDLDDPIAAKVAKKVEKGILAGVSAGGLPDETSDDKALYLSGQKYPTVTKWTLREASICTIPANHNAVALYDGALNRIELADYPTVLDYNLTKEEPKQKQTEEMELKTIQLSDGSTIKVAADDKESIQKIEAMQSKISALEQEKANQIKSEGIALVDKAIKEGRLDASGKDSMIQLYSKDPEQAKSIIAALPKAVKLTDKLTDGGEPKPEWIKLSWKELDQQGKLIELKEQYPEIYKEKYEASLKD